MGHQHTGKEAELDNLTNLLVKSMDATQDPDYFGRFEYIQFFLKVKL